MKFFCAGMRVRIKWSKNWPELAGQEGTIIGRTERRRGDNPACEWEVAPDCWGTSWAPRFADNGAGLFCPNSEQLEPIMPEGLESPEEMTELFAPEEMFVLTLAGKELVS